MVVTDRRYQAPKTLGFNQILRYKMSSSTQHLS